MPPAVLVICFHLIAISCVVWVPARYLLIATHGVLVITTIVLNVLVSATDTSDPNLRDPHNAKKTGFYCGTCDCSVHPDSRHCKTCNRCVLRFDHHCPWIGTCVGQKNYRRFVCLLVSTALLLLLELALGAVATAASFAEARQVRSRLPPSGNASPAHLHATQALVILYTAIAGLPLYYVWQLLTFHLILMRAGLTTYEYIMKERYRRLHEIEEEEAAAAAASAAAAEADAEKGEAYDAAKRHPDDPSDPDRMQGTPSTSAAHGKSSFSAASACRSSCCRRDTLPSHAMHAHAHGKNRTRVRINPCALLGFVHKTREERTPASAAADAGLLDSGRGAERVPVDASTAAQQHAGDAAAQHAMISPPEERAGAGPLPPGVGQGTPHITGPRPPRIDTVNVGSLGSEMPTPSYSAVVTPGDIHPATITPGAGPYAGQPRSSKLGARSQEVDQPFRPASRASSVVHPAPLPAGAAPSPQPFGPALSRQLSSTGPGPGLPRPHSGRGATVVPLPGPLTPEPAKPPSFLPPRPGSLKQPASGSGDLASAGPSISLAVGPGLVFPPLRGNSVGPGPGPAQPLFAGGVGGPGGSGLSNSFSAGFGRLSANGVGGGALDFAVGHGQPLPSTIREEDAQQRQSSPTNSPRPAVRASSYAPM